MSLIFIQFLNKLKNTYLKKKPFFLSFYNNSILLLIKILYSEGLIQSFKILFDNTVKVYLRYYNNLNPFETLKILSKSSSNTFLKYSDLCRLYNRNKFVLISTDKGFKTFIECKRIKL